MIPDSLQSEVYPFPNIYYLEGLKVYLYLIYYCHISVYCTLLHNNVYKFRDLLVLGVKT